MKIYFAGEPGGNFKDCNKRLLMIKNRLLSYHFILIKNSKTQKEIEKIIKSK